MPVLPELRLAVRGLVRDRAYTTLGLLSIAFGIAANTIIFSLVDGVLLRPLQYTEPGRLVAVNEVVAELAKTYPKLPVSARHYLEWKERASAFAHIGIVEADKAILTGSGDPELVEAARVSSDLLPMLGARLRLGRTFLDAPTISSCRPVTIAATCIFSGIRDEMSAWRMLSSLAAWATVRPGFSRPTTQ